MFGWGNKGKKLANQVADHLGIEHNLFDTALMETGMSWQHWKTLADGRLTVPMLAEHVTPEVKRGLDKLEAKWGQQPQIDAARATFEESDAQLRRVLGSIGLTPEQVEAVPDVTEFPEVERVREETFDDWISSLNLPAGMDGARVVTRLHKYYQQDWVDPNAFAEEAGTDKPMSDVMSALHAEELLGRGTTTDGEVVYRLSDSGMQLGDLMYRQWKLIRDLYRTPADLP